MSRRISSVCAVCLAVLVCLLGVLCFVEYQQLLVLNQRQAGCCNFPVQGGFESRVRVGKTVDQFVPAESGEKILYQNVSTDGLGEWDIAQSRFVAQSEGDYFVYLNFGYHATGKGAYPFWGHIYKNKDLEDKALIAGDHGHQIGSGCPFGKCAALVHLEAGDYLEAWTVNTCPEEKLMPGRDDITACQVNNFVIFRIY